MKTAKHIICLMIMVCTQYAYGQVTTATLSGKITSKDKQPLAGATVNVSYPEAGIKKNIIAQADGSFVIPNLRVGGPYTIITSFAGYQENKEENIFLELGQNTSLDIQLETALTDLGPVLVTGKSKVFDNQRTGASTNISSRQLRSLPTISRSADDFTRLTPSASATYNGTSFAGRNGQYNNYSLDGAVFNNPFGLDAPTPGGQTGAQPISLDAIDQIQVNIAPYDVTQAGFTGAGINTVTKSGTNTFGGTVYGFFRNQGMTGKKVEGNDIVVPDLNQLQAGFSLGGALKKDKLFYFVNFETEQREDAASSYVARNASNENNNNTSRVLESDLVAVSNILKQRFEYETGPYQGFNLKQTNYKWIAKLDWVINNNHSLSFTYNGLDATKEKPAHPSAIGRRGPDYQTLQFRNSGYEIENKLQSFGAELKSNFGSKYANKLRAVFTTFRDKRNPFSEPFPVVNITKYGTRYIIAGHEPFSINNRLNQDAFQFTDNFNIILPKHTITAGASFESFKFANSFNLTGYGLTLFSETNIQNFLDSVPVGGNSVNPFGIPGFYYPLDNDVTGAKSAAAANQWTWYYLTVAQISAYIQDEWKLSDRLRITLGLRMDIPQYLNASYQTPTGEKFEPTVPNNDPLTLFDPSGKPITNGEGKDLDNTQLPSTTPLFSPRLGFNWDVNGNKTFQVRGGSGLFTGRFPFVWVGNHIGNPYTSFYCATDKDFQWPQIWRTNIGADLKIPSGTIFTLDIAYSKDVNAMMVRNYKLGTPTGTLNSGFGDTRKVYTTNDKGADNENAYIFTNTDVGDQFNASFQVQQSFKNNFFAMASYNYLTANDASSISAEISSDAFDRNPVLNNSNAAINSRSLYGNTHRIVLAGIKRFDYGKEKQFGTTVSLFGNWSSGNRFAYVYGGDINADGTSTNDLMYVPTDAQIDQMNFANLTDVNGENQDQAAQRTAFKKFIGQDEYLSSRRGNYTEKYEGEMPWFSQVDMRILQDFNFKPGKKTNTIQLSLDFINIGNLLNSDWGVRKLSTTTGYYQPISVSVNNNQPTYQFDPSQTSTFIASPDLPSRWQMQLGLRYIF